MEVLSIQRIPVENKPEMLMWEIHGAMDSPGIELFTNEFKTVLQKKQHFLVAEMSGVIQVSSSALGFLMECKQVLVEKGGDLVIAGITMDVKTKLTLMGATKIFKFYPDLRSAINAYNWDIEHKSEKIWLSFPPNLQFVPPVRQMVNRIARQKGYSQRDAFRIETIIDETCNNAVEHGSAVLCKNIDLNVIIDRDKIQIEVTNASDPDKIESLKALSKSVIKTDGTTIDDKRGRGLALIKMLSNDLSINCSSDGTTVHVTKLREE